MYNIYCIKVCLFWNYWQVIISFFGIMFSLGVVLLGVFLLLVYLINGIESVGLVIILGVMVVIGLVVESVGLVVYVCYLNMEFGEGVVVYYIQNIIFGKIYMVWNVVLVGCIVLGLVLVLMLLQGIGVLVLFVILLLVFVVILLVGWVLFYVLVILIIMLGVFFWKNKGFEEYVWDIGLVNMFQVGVVLYLY